MENASGSALKLGFEAGSGRSLTASPTFPARRQHNRNFVIAAIGVGVRESRSASSSFTGSFGVSVEIHH
jgi:hypothetical protein